MLCKLGLYTCLTPASSRGLSAGPPGSPSSSACSTGTCPLSILDAVFPWIGRFCQAAGRPLCQATGRPLCQAAGRPLCQASGRPLFQAYERPLFQASGRPHMYEYAGLSWLQTVAMGLYKLPKGMVFIL